jgi:hypothetical protein
VTAARQFGHGAPGLSVRAPEGAWNNAASGDLSPDAALLQPDRSVPAILPDAEPALAGTSRRSTF